MLASSQLRAKREHALCRPKQTLNERLFSADAVEKVALATVMHL
jgi:hypothetical protein